MDLNSASNTSNSIDFKALARTYTKKWKWFFLSVVTALSIAYIFIRYSQPQYAAEAKIKILEDKGSSPELSLFKDLGSFSGSGTSGIGDEIQAIKSRSNLMEVVNELQLNLKIVALGNILDSEIYGKTPFKVSFIEPDSLIQNSSFQFFVDLSTETTFGYATHEDEPVKVYSFGNNIPSPIGDIVLTPNIPNLTKSKGKRFKVSITPVPQVAHYYQNKIVIAPIEKSSSILNIYLNDQIQSKAQHIINTLVDIYNKNAVLDKKAIADRTSDFIDDRITEISTSLSTVDQTAEDFKTGRGITDIASEATMNLNVGAANQQELQNTTTQLNIAESMKDIVDNDEGYELLPSNVGLSDVTISNTTAKYNELVLERNRLLKSSNEKNPIIVNLDQQLAGLKRNMQSSLNSVTNNLNLQVNSLSSQLSRINSKIYSAPRNERALRDITRQQQTTESLYLYLLEKREESQIAFASAAPKSKIVDRAFSLSSAPVSPNKRMIYLAAFVLGLILPFSIIYLNDLLDNKIHNKTGLEKLVRDVPVLAELPKLSKKDKKMVLKDDRSVLAESLRILRTNLDYLMKSKRGSGKNNIIFITSSVPGEGKTFLSSNLAMIFSNTNKKVLLVGGDIRNPKLYSFFDNKKSEIDKLGKISRNADLGLTEFLYDDSLTSKDVINSMLVHSNSIDVIYSGKIPPNPAELLMSKRMKGLLQEVGETYDYVIVDTAPLMVVSDTLVISEYADHIIYVTRAGVTETSVVDFPIKLMEEGKLKNLSFVVNDVKHSNLGYGGKYGYGYGITTRKWWKFG